MPFNIIRQDITKVQADAIINTASPYPSIGSGTDSAIYIAAGVAELFKEREKIGDIARGDSAITPAFNLNAKYIIHTVGPKWQGGENNEENILRNCYKNSLALAYKKGCKSIAFPLISTGNYGFPKDLALKIANEEICNFLISNDEDIKVILTIFDKETTLLSNKLYDQITSFITNEEASSIAKIEYDTWEFERNTSRRLSARERRRERSRRFEDKTFENRHSSTKVEKINTPISASRKKAANIDTFINAHAENFTEMLFRLIKEKGMKNSEVYYKANITKSHFSKIKNGSIHPSKDTVISLAIALCLNMDQTIDLLAREGYSFIPGNKRDLIIQFFISTENYDMFTIEEALYDYNLPTLS